MTSDSDRQNARAVREAWMQMMGLDHDEIARECQADPPHDFEEELEQCNAMFDVERLNSQSWSREKPRI